ncbi:MAG: hypothetical protein JST91_23850 [Actinobacteria bacterium]|nr:hypothetical protein [Actinomycetota bacterium]
MTGPDNSSTRPISVAELLAKNGTIGAPPVGGRRRRRRGNADAVTVAELTGEIPIVTADVKPAQKAPEQPPEKPGERPEPAEAAQSAATDTAAPADSDAPPPAGHLDTVHTNGAGAQTAEDVPVEHSDAADTETPSDTEAPSGTDTDDDDYADAVAEYAAHLEARDAEPEPLDFTPQRRRPARTPETSGGAEEMSPDPVADDDDSLDGALDLEEPEVDYDDDAAPEAATPDDAADADELPSYLRSSQDPLFGGQSVADDIARRRGDIGPEDIDLGDDAADLDDADEADRDTDDDESDEQSPATKSSTLVHGAVVVGQCVVAVALGAGLFVAFDQLWKWNNIVALVLSVLVILGLVVGVRVVRKTEDIGSTLIAVAVGALVTLGPLALLQSG